MTLTGLNNVKCTEFILNKETNVMTCNDAKLEGKGLSSCFYPDTYLRKEGDGKASASEDPIIKYVLGFRDSVPDYVDLTSERTTVVLSENVLLNFKIGSVWTDGKVIIGGDDNIVGESKLIYDKIDVPSWTTKYYEIGHFEYKGLRVNVNINQQDVENGCKVTDEGIKNLFSVENGYWGGLFDRYLGVNSIEDLTDVGCLGFIEIPEDENNKCSDPSDPVCQKLERLVDRTVRKRQYFRYGDRMSISQVRSDVDGTESGSDYWIELFDTNNDYSIDVIGINNGRESDRKQYISYTDTGTGFDQVALKDCRIPTGVMISEFEKNQEYENNYCYAQPSAGSITLNWGENIFIVGSGIVAAASGGSSLLLSAAIAGTGATMGVSSDILEAWPNAGG
jgi:hypothetical protein